MVDPSDYVVLDVETNGLDEERDDLLSISVYVPDEGRTYDRFLPLERQAKLSPDAARVNGITEEDLAGREPLSQVEVDELLEGWHVGERTVLTFSGSGFDERFLRSYMESHGLTGYSQVKFLDIKSMVCRLGEGHSRASKDNLCRAFGISGVSEIHTSANDCLLEWRLFEAMDGLPVVVAGDVVYCCERVGELPHPAVR
jgi:DNA polymerase III epsilon subunit-like protein